MIKAEHKKEYAAVDLFKFICAILVVVIHAKPFENIFWLDAGIGLVTRFAVPYFFLSSSYFLFKKLLNCETFKEKFKVYFAYFLRLIRFYAIWFVIFNLVDVAFGSHINSPMWYLKQFVFTTNGSPLWFMSALIWGSLIVFLLSCVLNKYLVFGISCALWLLGYMLSTLLGVTSEWGFIALINKNVTPIIGTQNGFYFALPYVALAAIMATQTIKKEHKKNAILTGLFFILLGVESVVAVMFLNAPFTFLWLSALPMAYFAMRLTLTIEIKPNPIFFYMRKTSTMIYVLHYVVIKILKAIFSATAFGAFDIHNLLLLILTIVFTVSLSCLAVKASSSKRLCFLKYIM